MRTNRRPRTIILALGVIGLALVFGAVWHYRRPLRDFAWRLEQPPVPVAVTAREAREQAAKNGLLAAATDEPALVAPPKPTEEVIAPAVSGNAADEPAGAPPARPAEPPPVVATPPAAPSPKVELPKEFNLAVPMVYQAPKSVWDALHEDACEEAAMLMMKWFLDGKASGTRDEMDAELQRIVAYETGIGFGLSIDADQTIEVMSAYLKISGARVLPVHSIDDVKLQIASGHPVILPADGKALKNPNFRNGGPPYHMLVAKGYTAAGKIVTNDPGTRLGADYVYSADLLFGAIHDWNGGDVANGRKVMIVVE